MIEDWINNFTLTHILLIIIIFLLGLLVIGVYNLVTVFYEDITMGNRSNILNQLLRELYDQSYVLKNISDGTSDLVGLIDTVSHIQDDVEKIAPKSNRDWRG
tara:strand:+ start:1678 stop:1983 length:306 start_codon:yes stop_codon:yes gene_type:complete